MPSVISNSSPLISLSAIQRLDLLRDFFGTVIVPPAVWREVVEEGQGRAGAAEVETAGSEGWIRIETFSNDLLLRLLKRDLDDGEAEAITLAIETNAALILLDETEARRIADTYGLKKTGTVGILIRAKLAGKVDSLKDELNRLRSDAGFRLEDGLYRQALISVGENPS